MTYLIPQSDLFSIVKDDTGYIYSIVAVIEGLKRCISSLLIRICLLCFTFSFFVQNTLDIVSHDIVTAKLFNLYIFDNWQVLMFDTHMKNYAEMNRFVTQPLMLVQYRFYNVKYEICIKQKPVQCTKPWICKIIFSHMVLTHGTRKN